MKENKVNLLLWGISIVGFAVLSFSFLLMPLDRVGFVPGVLFWGGLLIGVVLQVVLGRRRSSFYAKHSVKREKMKKTRNGFVSFCSNRPALWADGCMLVSILATIGAFVLTNGKGYICYVCISALILSFCMHCIFNGKIYAFIKNQNKARQMAGQKKANSMEKGEGKK